MITPKIEAQNEGSVWSGKRGSVWTEIPQNHNPHRNSGEEGNGFSINVELMDVNAAVLGQNTPNPFSEQTVICYSIPSTANSSQLLFYDASGKLIKKIDIKITGRGQLNVFANDLSTGIYSYTLVIDEKVVGSKKMMKQN